MKNHKILSYIISGDLILMSYLFNAKTINKNIDNPNFINNQAIAQNHYQTKKIYRSDRQYLVSYDGNKFYVRDISGNIVKPDTPSNRNLLIDLANCYLTDDAVNYLGVNKLGNDVSNLENLVAKSIGHNILNIALSVWKNKTDPFGLLNVILMTGNRLEIDPRFYIAVLAGNISSNLGKVQREAVSLIDRYPTLDAFVYGRVRYLLEDSEPYIEPSFFLLRDALRSSNYELSDSEKKMLSDLSPDERRKYILEKIKNTPEFSRFTADVTGRQADWGRLRKKASSIVYY